MREGPGPHCQYLPDCPALLPTCNPICFCSSLFLFWSKVLPPLAFTNTAPSCRHRPLSHNATTLGAARALLPLRSPVSQPAMDDDDDGDAFRELLALAECAPEAGAASAADCDPGAFPPSKC